MEGKIEDGTTHYASGLSLRVQAPNGKSGNLSETDILNGTIIWWDNTNEQKEE